MTGSPARITRPFGQPVNEAVRSRPEMKSPVIGTRSPANSSIAQRMSANTASSLRPARTVSRKRRWPIATASAQRRSSTSSASVLVARARRSAGVMSSAGSTGSRSAKCAGKTPRSATTRPPTPRRVTSARTAAR